MFKSFPFISILLLLAACGRDAIEIKEGESKPQDILLSLLPPGSQINSNMRFDGTENQIETPLGPVLVKCDPNGTPVFISELETGLRWVLCFQTEKEQDGRETDLLLRPNGQLVLSIPENDFETEHQISWEELPQPVQSTILRFHKAQKPRLVQREVEGAALIFEAVLQDLHGTYELAILPDGQILYWEPPALMPLPPALKSKTYDERPEPVILVVEEQGDGWFLMDGTRITGLPD